MKIPSLLAIHLAVIPLFFPELENIIKGFVILSSAPSVPSVSTVEVNEFEMLRREYNLPSGSEAAAAFLNNPSVSTIINNYLSIVPYAFPAESLEDGIKIIEHLVYNVDTFYWWLTDGSKKHAEISWIPEKVPTFILGGTRDCLTPLSMFEQDQRFHRNNIEMVCIPNAGHFPWIEQPNQVKDAFSLFIEKLNFNK